MSLSNKLAGEYSNEICENFLLQEYEAEHKFILHNYMERQVSLIKVAKSSHYFLCTSQFLVIEIYYQKRNMHYMETSIMTRKKPKYMGYIISWLWSFNWRMASNVHKSDENIAIDKGYVVANAVNVLAMILEKDLKVTDTKKRNYML